MQKLRFGSLLEPADQSLRQEIEDLSPFLENKTLSLFGVQPRETLFIYFL